MYKKITLNIIASIAFLGMFPEASLGQTTQPSCGVQSQSCSGGYGCGAFYNESGYNCISECTSGGCSQGENCCFDQQGYAKKLKEKK